jgi:hypothetical protein
MASDPRKRQKKLERRASKRKEKKHLQVRGQSAGLTERLTAAARFPVLHSWITEDLWTQGLGWVLLSRTFPDGMVAVAVFLVDRYCLGVKDAMARFISRSTYEAEFVRKMHGTFASRNVSPATVRKLVEEAVAYARGLGLSPHADYQKAKLLFGDIDPAQSTEVFEFGKDGQPLFIAGPNDTPGRCQNILGILTQSCGPDGFHYIMPMAEGEHFRLIGTDEDEDVLDDDEGPEGWGPPSHPPRLD